MNYHDGVQKIYEDMPGLELEILKKWSPAHIIMKDIIALQT